MNIKDIHNVYFIGIGGIGMSALARYFNFIGKSVSGYDKTSTPLTQDLMSHGIQVHYEDNLSLIPSGYRDPEKTLVVYTPAVPGTHKEYTYFKANGFQVKKRSEVLGMITKDSFCFAVAGTHGKTTVSCILAHILKETGMPLTAFLGGISEDFNSNFLLEGTEYSVVEADEFDRSFLQLSPNIACITSMDADHLDIYGNKDELVKSFKDFTARLKPNGKLFVRNGLPIEGITYGLEDDSDYSIVNLAIEDGAYVFDIRTPETTVERVRFHKPGHHNLLNGLVAFAMASQSGASLRSLADALGTFKGVQRRFSYQIRTEKFVFIDDYAHHPTEIDAVHQAVSEMHAGKKVLAVFQPHLFSRTRDFIDDFARSLSKFYSVLLLDIYPAREEPIAGVNSQWLLDKMEGTNKKLIDKEGLIAEIKSQAPDVLLTIGAGDIGLEVQKIKKELQ
ncbi:UDP-N-acetylmuramate--L-alanine ligase [Arenibacter amylolyticus]|uniref:UDP-N-acetylmuramate--L-alanine ligase n=1 Tax=Arenibacter amylolyticus TaxID=1406873 RepID=UPI000A35F159|nr:UDP-N-acetylmuramate--L-alanine ligase [Arenibacter amylolyticus]